MLPPARARRATWHFENKYCTHIQYMQALRMSSSRFAPNHTKEAVDYEGCAAALSLWHRASNFLFHPMSYLFARMTQVCAVCHIA